MNASLQTIPLTHLVFVAAPVLVVIVMLFRWSTGAGTALYAVGRMLVQLLLIGYVLTFVFETNHALVVVGVLGVMLAAASWIALRPIARNRKAVYWKALIAIAVGGVFSLAVVVLAVLRPESWYEPRVVVPLAGMIFANSMNTVSIAAERFDSENRSGTSYLQARKAALNAGLIPLVNSLFAVGLVSFPGMMTGQILSGVEPLVAARYQIMVMCMIFGSAGVSAVVYLAQMAPAMHKPS